MDPEGYLPVTLIASFNRVIALSADLALIIAAVKESDKLEVYNDYKVRTKIDPTKWPLSATDSNPPISNVPEKSYMSAKHAPTPSSSSSTSTLSSAALAGNEFYPAGYENGDISTTASVVPLSDVLDKIPPPPVLKNAKKKPITGSTNASAASTTTTASSDATTTTTNNNSKVDNNNTSSSVQPLQMAVVCK